MNFSSIHLNRRFGPTGPSQSMLPPWMNWYAILTMATTLASIVGVAEMMTLTGRITAAESRTDLLIPIYAYVLLWFFAYCYPIARWTRQLEARYAER